MFTNIIRYLKSKSLEKILDELVYFTSISIHIRKEGPKYTIRIRDFYNSDHDHKNQLNYISSTDILGSILSNLDPEQKPISYYRTNVRNYYKLNLMLVEIVEAYYLTIRIDRKVMNYFPTFYFTATSWRRPGNISINKIYTTGETHKDYFLMKVLRRFKIS